MIINYKIADITNLPLSVEVRVGTFYITKKWYNSGTLWIRIATIPESMNARWFDSPEVAVKFMNEYERNNG